MLNGLDLFSGIGGIALALAPWVRPIAYVEIDQYCQSVIASRMAGSQLPQAPIWDDVRTFKMPATVPVDIIVGGFPCQDISIAGAGAGLAGERSGLFWEVARLCRELRPRFVFLENVPAITHRGGLEVVGALTALGYDCRWCVISASGVGAPFKGERWFLLGRLQDSTTARERLEGRVQHKKEESSGLLQELVFHPVQDAHWASCPLPDVHNVGDGVSERMDAARALGNAVVPQQARKAFELLMGL